MRKQFFFTLLLLFFVLHTGETNAQISITQPAEGMVSPLTNQAIIGAALPGMPVRVEVNGVVVDSGSVRIDGVYEFLGVRCPRGPVKVKTTVRLKNGKEFSAERSFHILGDPDSIALELDAEELPADGNSTIHGTISLLDKWRVRIPSGYFITLHADSLRILGEDADGYSAGHQLKLVNGVAPFTLQSSTYAGPVTLSVTTNALSRTYALYAVTPRIPFILVGSADGTVRNQKTTGVTEGLSPADDFADGFRKQGRIAATGRGSIFGNYLFTLSVDTDRKLQDKIFRDLDPDALYSMYGDNSIVTYEAQSTSPVFAKIEKNQSYALYGDFNTGLTKNEFAAYNRSFTGGKVHLQSEDASLDLFGTVTNRKVVQEELRGLGISGYYFLKQNNIVTGSEKIRIESRDRFRSEVVVSSKDRVRHADYEIDYVQGTLYFKQPVPSLDDQKNPVYIVVSYEANTDKADNLVAGGAGELTLFNTLTLGATSVVENRDPKNYVLLGGHAKFRFGDALQLAGEGARSNDLDTKGGAWKLEAELTPAKWIALRPYYRKVDGTFVNTTQSGSGRELGTRNYGATMNLEPWGDTKLSGDYYDQEQTQGSLTTAIRSISGSVEQSLWQGTNVAVKVEDVDYKGANPEAPTQNLVTRSTILSSRAQSRIAERLTATAEYEHNLKKGAREVRPDAVGVGLEYRVSETISLYGQQKFLQGQGNLTTVGVNTKVTDQTTLYGRYEIGNAISGERNAATVGLKNTLKLTDDITTNFLYEKTKNLGKQLAEARTDDHDAISLSVEYLPAYPLKATVKGEYFEDANNLRRGLDYGLSYRLFTDLSLIGKGTLYRAVARTQQGYTRQEHYLAGLAYRPVEINWLNVIGKFERKIQDNTVVQPAEFRSATIVSAHAYIEPVNSFEVGVKYALRNAEEHLDGTLFASTTDFILVRPQLDVTTWLNLAGEGRFLRQHKANDIKVGYSGEIGIVALKNTMIAFGYTFKGYKDRDFVNYIYSASGPYVTFRLKFTEELFGIDILE